MVRQNKEQQLPEETTEETTGEMASGNSGISGTEVQAPTPFERLCRQMALRAKIEDDSTNVMRQQVENILMTEFEDDESVIWDADEGGPLGGRNLVGVEQEVRGFQIKKSRAGADSGIKSMFLDEGGVGMYLLIDAIRLDTGEVLPWNTSAPLVVAKLMRFESLGKLPLQCVLQGTELGGGATVLKLRPIPKRAVKSDTA